ncbi:dockerin type I domain-containing protein [Ruminococcus sp.]|uniref:dockerin type I domain-containing protein n=1 Tax=Ruminococcus sp. TaxID=41978 RepID=UPI00260016B9|nr:dockerin type I domain-containing protein [Ruminococcus sp.]MEE0022386.1 dockerin type I domain-containing protein [Ruminococcus sp.]
MRTKKVFGFFTAAVMAVASLPILSVGAADSTVLLGDVDQDGVITGHDSAMVSRYLNVDSTMFTEEQLKLADINEDGVVDQTDADLIHEKEVFCIGDFTKMNEVSIEAALRALTCYAEESAGETLSIVDKMTLTQPVQFEEDYGGWFSWSGTNYGDPIYIGLKDGSMKQVTDPLLYEALFQNASWQKNPLEITQLDYNLIDANGDGVVDLDDATNLLYSFAYSYAAVDHSKMYFSEGRYDLYNGQWFKQDTSKFLEED